MAKDMSKTQEAAKKEVAGLKRKGWLTQKQADKLAPTYAVRVGVYNRDVRKKKPTASLKHAVWKKKRATWLAAGNVPKRKGKGKGKNKGREFN